jgi:hypothetical protein
MIAAGMEAVLIKVAGIGLATKHLGKTLTEMQPTLTTLVGETFLSYSLIMIELSVVEHLVWFAHLRGGRRVRDIDS